MRTRSNSTEPEGVRLNFLPGHAARSAGGGWFNGKFLRLFRSPRGQDSVNITSITDGHISPSRDEEPQNVILTFAQTLEEQNLSEASQMLIEREERLFWEETEAEGLPGHEEEVNDLAADRKVLERHILRTLMQSLSRGTSTDALMSAVKAVYQEDQQDQLWKQRDRTQPDFRPCGWKKLHDETLRSLVKDRMDNLSTTPAHGVEQPSIEAHICSMGRQLMEDLPLVVDVGKTCYPPESGIFDFYARLYHQTFSSRLREIADFGLEDKDCTYLLLWVNEYYPGLLQKPELVSSINAEALGKLLPKELLEPLEEQYLNNKQGELTTYISRVLDEANQMWDNGEEPTKEDGYYVSPVAYDIIQFINGMVSSAAKVVGDLNKAQSITCKLNGLMHSFKIFQDKVVKQNRPNSKAIIKANLGCIQQFRDVLQKNGHLFREDVRQDCLHVLTDMRESAHSYLLSPVHEALKRQYRKLGTSEWLKKPLFEELLVNIQTEAEELQGAKESCHQELICQFHEEVTVEYVRRLLKGEVKLRGKEQQSEAYATVMDNAESLHKLFAEMGSKEDWLRDILTNIAEVLKLQELPAIQTEVFSLGSAFPDLSEKHLSALLKLKANLSKGDRRTVKETLSDALRETSGDGSRPFFSKVQVKTCFILFKR
ncbi:putative tumor necrosis factor alpha-induced protein 2 [Scophthalmus maximus]|uniref:Putative tumor necrosis factor alpha-induced protein 2 n=1 Tax=Scophthalmus maximus TaxID=52904 RepID=A0A2U9CH88_SCOMX|nr:tumor necrosis factor alpha-induced protein 2 [Scophthalmus maximus]AWP15985.1 putative tumor necrosis factor alpha-induced protein 2 [Scophthalmus maximus]